MVHNGHDYWGAEKTIITAELRAAENILRSLLENPNYLKFSWLLVGALTDIADTMKCQKYHYEPTRETAYTSCTRGLCLIFPLLHFKVTKITSFTSELKISSDSYKRLKGCAAILAIGRFLAMPSVKHSQQP